MSKVFNSSETAKTINRAIDNNQGTTTIEQGAASAGLIINEDLTNVVECTGGYMNPFQLKEITAEPPIEFHAVERPLTYYAIYGNEDSGDYVGDLSRNIFNGHERVPGSFYRDTGVIGTQSNYAISDYIDVMDVENVTISSTSALGGDAAVCQFDENYTYITGTKYNNEKIVTISITSGCKYISMSFKSLEVGNIMVNSGDSALSYEPYGKYKIPITNANVTYTAYISDVLRKSSGEDPVYDIMYSDGTIIRNVDTDGTPLAEPTTETYTPVTVQCIWGYNEIDVDTTVSPSKMTIKYYDN